MIAPMTPPAIYSPVTDRSVGDAGVALRKSIESALAIRDPHDRGPEIYRRVSAALHKASDEEGTFTSPEAFGRTLEILTLLPRNIPLPQVVVESENEIGLDWDEGKHRVVSLTVRSTPMVGFAAFFGAEPLYGRMPFIGEVPETLSYLLARLFPQRTGR